MDLIIKIKLKKQEKNDGWIDGEELGKPWIDRLFDE